MRLERVFLFLLAIAVAIVVGWFFDTPKRLVKRQPLEVPDNVDSYMSGVDYRALDRQGKLHYHLQSPYLEHFRREDISHIESPRVNYLTADSHWNMVALDGTLLHQQEILEMTREVNLRSQQGDQPMHLQTERMIVHPNQDLVDIPTALTLVTDRLDLQAGDATLDVGNQQYRFNRVKAVYRQADSHVPG